MTSTPKPLPGAATRDARRALAKQLGLMPTFGEELKNFTFNTSRGVLSVHVTSKEEQVGTLAVTGDPAAHGLPVFTGRPGVWHAPPRDRGGLSVIALDFAAAYSGFRVGANATLLCVDPARRAAMAPGEWTDLIRNDLEDDLRDAHGDPWCWIVASSPGTRLNPAALDAILVAIGDFSRTPTILLPEFDLVEPGSTERDPWLLQRALRRRIDDVPRRAHRVVTGLLSNRWEDEDCEE